MTVRWCQSGSWRSTRERVELGFIKFTELVKKSEGYRCAVVAVSPLPGLKGALPIPQGDFSKNTVTNIEAVTVILG